LTKGYKGLLDNEQNKIIHKVQTTLSASTPLPLPPVSRVVSTLWATRSSRAKYARYTHRKFQDFHLTPTACRVIL